MTALAALAAAGSGLPPAVQEYLLQARQMQALSFVAHIPLVTWRYTLGRFTAALAVAAILVGWGLAQRPVFLPGLTVAQAAAPEPTLIAVVVAVLPGGLILAPSLALLFRLVLGGRFDPGGAQPALATPAARQTTSPRGRAGLLLSSAVTCLAVGVGLLSVVEIGWRTPSESSHCLDSSFWRSSA